MIIVPLLALAATPQPLVGHQTIDRPFTAQPSAIEGITELHTTRDWHADLRGIDSLLVNDFFLDQDCSVILELERRDVVDPRADLRLGEEGELDAPDVVTLGGRVAGDPGSIAYLAFSDSMTMGFVQTDGEQYVISSGPADQDLPTVVYNLGDISNNTISLRDIACQTIEVPGMQSLSIEAPTTARRGVVPCRVVDVAIDTDTEFRTDLFGGNAGDAADYITMLTAAISEVYERDLNVKLNITFARVWTSTDPWNQGGTVDQLFQFEDYWNANMTGVARDNAHFFSGRGLGGGVAYVGAICKDYSYALSANFNGFFPYPLQNQSTQNWDFMVTAHEWGHNFGAPHTHQQSPLANIDNCGNGTCDNLPGTIMSYCHTCGNGTGDVNLNFHPQNINSYMLAYLDNSGQWSGAGAPCDLTGDPLCNDDPCGTADTNGDGQLTPADFNAWILAFNNQSPECDQNGDGNCNPGDFNAWVLNYNAGC
ncbi:MAG: zinc-dependent metalloprotease [Planctomycetota bacterium]